jgi:predicted nucleotidyltransferase
MAAMATSKLNVKAALSRLKLEDSKVLNVYVMGSRLWGTARPSSDWDLIIVHEDSAVAARRSLHHGDIDAIALHRDEYIAQIREHHFLELATLWVPPSLVWREKLDPRRVLRSSVVDVAKLVAAVEEESARDWTMARKFAEKGDAHRATRVLSHTIRMLVLACGVVRDGAIAAWDAGNAAAKSARDLEAEEVASGGWWPVLEHQMGPIRDDLLTKLRETAAKKGR